MHKNKIFQYEEYKDCHFIVSHYLTDKNAIAIIIEDDITRKTIKCTTYIPKIEYKEGIATIKNYSENQGITDFLISLGVVTEVIEKKKVNELAEDTETIDICKIDLKKLKDFATEWHFERRK